jgi:hypothetical protein
MDIDYGGRTAESWLDTVCKDRNVPARGFENSELRAIAVTGAR